MSLGFGKVIKYFENGFGFIQPLENKITFNKNEIFFHIKKVKKFESKLEQFRLDNSHDLHFWFHTIEGKKGEEVAEFWDQVSDISSSLVNEFLTNVSNSLIEINKPKETVEVKSEIKVFHQIKKLSLDLTTSNISILCEKYRLEPIGIRSERSMRHVCLDCGTDNTEYKKLERGQYKPISSFVPNRYTNSAEGFHRCCNCGSKWYINYCWSCHTGRVDDRDPKTPRCSECSWCKCEKCSSCSYYGCETNDYSKDNKYVDNQPIML
ncbi:hypothetical protein C9J20_20325 [Photobacterium phosphoreum]|uniref:hypothetical protein n=1 Tax=Photobacterium phosphoreum TaxID=659 RepID=UPI000D15DB04|nr:hypothetical protein [Photobacterium phosphoreum]MCD9505991.1 hypothetical protein [Photobacterium phosphoreum]PSU67001.1 hypothetical protein CTM79_17460 [Photobacterium phosphoreum]PSW07020.1 hypothetical protein C9J20_20325 [Photobacterium phosphoreum]